MKKWVLLLGASLLLVACSPKETKKTTRAIESSASTVKIEEPEETTEPSEKRIENRFFEKGSLIKAVENNDIHLVNQILQVKDYDINEVNDKKESPLLIATHNNQVEIAKSLIDSGADINQQDAIQDSPYLYAGAQGKTEILAYMMEKSTPNQRIVNRYGGNALIPAAEKGHLDNVKLLLTDKSVDINHQNDFGYTALIEAIALRDGSKVYQDIVSVLLENGADKTLKDSTGRDAEDYARELGYGNMLKMLQKAE
ncbi:ankyrin repeat domain-containing protein [Vagococcus carniphilus]|uniref:ankyrin repeat domain-containing protein n=1 Tax=Vagococcus carniphilus TaxID=218144 RepID=UPI002890A500|nr:ankyrin repeat domain-containing protein [Vagococcus carniphilus]MDT2813317.1 ankyrin repeat domain-containing protein [Vagococcus carniphilus]MDT2865264.1 ankyrin repeat domain-containing protein [Vagococcus carniphilus]